VPGEVIHLVEPGAIVRQRMTTARCGASVDYRHGHGQVATCASCLELERQDEEAVEELRSATFPAPPVRPSFNPLAGYTPNRR
jgi:hypothetical protein